MNRIVKKLKEVLNNQVERLFNSSFNNIIVIPRVNLPFVDGYKITIIEKKPTGMELREVVIPQIYQENPISMTKIFSAVKGNTYILHPGTINTSTCRVKVEVNGNYINSSDFEFNSVSKTVTIKNNTPIFEDDVVKISFYVDGVQYEFNSEYRCFTVIDVIYSKSHKIGDHNIIE